MTSPLMEDEPMSQSSQRLTLPHQVALFPRWHGNQFNSLCNSPSSSLPQINLTPQPPSPSQPTHPNPSTRHSPTQTPSRAPPARSRASTPSVSSAHAPRSSPA